jgi:hypothetical protein
VSVIDPVASTPGQVASATDYGATLEGVLTYLPHRQIDGNSQPSYVQVQQMLDNVTSQVALTIGDLGHLSGSFLADVLTNACMCAQIGAAAWAEDAAYPERIDSQNNSGWGAILWTRFNAMIEKLAITVSRGPTAPDTGPLYPDLGTAWFKPLDPLIVDVGGALVQDYSDPYAYPDNSVDEVQTEINDTSGFDSDYSQGVGPGGDYEDVG